MRPIEDRSLIATRNALALDGTDQHVTIPVTSKYDFGTGDFTISIIVQNSNPTAVIAHFLNSSGSEIKLRHNVAPITIKSDQGTTYTPTAMSSAPSTSNLFRLTVIRRGNTLEGWINNKIYGSVGITAGHSFNLNTSNANTTFKVGCDGSLANFVNGFVANLIVVKGYAFVEEDLYYLHNTNILNKTTHQYVVAHYPFTQNYSTTAFDAVAQYDYAKIATTSASHATLVNYSNDEAGITNPLIQTAWKSLYRKNKKGEFFYKPNGSNHYAQCDNFSNVAVGSNYAIYMRLVWNKNSDYSSIFNSKESGVSGRIKIYDDPYGVWNTITVASYSSSSFLAGIGTDVTFVDGDLIEFLFIQYTENSNLRFAVIVRKNNGSIVVKNNSSAFDPSEFNHSFELAKFWSDSFGQYSKHRIGKFVLRQGNIQLTPSSSQLTREAQVLFNASLTDEYKKLGGVLIDVDFGDVFLSGANYYARDDSGNNRHAQLYNFAPATDQPLFLEQRNGVPDRRKALRFNGTSHHIKISNFNPTAEKGYTFIFGFCLDSNRVFNPDYHDIFWSKRTNDNSVKKLMYGNGSNKDVAYDGSAFQQLSLGASDLSKPQIISVVEDFRFNNQPGLKVFTSMSLRADYASGVITSLTGFDAIDGDFYLGADDLVNFPDRLFNGYIFHFSVFKGNFKNDQVLSIVNNTLNGNASGYLMPDCQLYLNFDEILVNGTTYTIRDWSPQNRSVVLQNYTADEVNPAHADYKLFDLDTLR